MTRTRLILAIVLPLLVIVLIAREAGLVRLNASFKETNSSQTAHYTSSQGGEKQPLSFDITLTHNGKTWMEHRRIILGAPRMHITGELTDIEYSGVDWLPLHKNFTMTYRCEFASAPDQESPTLKGSIKGEMHIRITGFCSRREARRLALDEAKTKIREYIQKQSF